MKKSKKVKGCCVKPGQLCNQNGMQQSVQNPGNPKNLRALHAKVLAFRPK